MPLSCSHSSSCLIPAEIHKLDIPLPITPTRADLVTIFLACLPHQRQLGVRKSKSHYLHQPCGKITHLGCGRPRIQQVPCLIWSRDLDPCCPGECTNHPAILHGPLSISPVEVVPLCITNEILIGPEREWKLFCNPEVKALIWRIQELSSSSFSNSGRTGIWKQISYIPDEYPNH